MDTEDPRPVAWQQYILDPRMRAHIRFAQTYAREFNHGAPGHLDLLTIAALADQIDRLHRTIVRGNDHDIEHERSWDPSKAYWVSGGRTSGDAGQ